MSSFPVLQGWEAWMSLGCLGSGYQIPWLLRWWKVNLCPPPIPSLTVSHTQGNNNGSAVMFKASLPGDNSDPIHHLWAVWSWTSLNNTFVLLLPHLSSRDNNTAWLLGGLHFWNPNTLKMKSFFTYVWSKIWSKSISYALYLSNLVWLVLCFTKEMLMFLIIGCSPRLCLGVLYRVYHITFLTSDKF